MPHSALLRTPGTYPDTRALTHGVCCHGSRLRRRNPPRNAQPIQISRQIWSWSNSRAMTALEVEESMTRRRWVNALTIRPISSRRILPGVAISLLNHNYFRHYAGAGQGCAGGKSAQKRGLPRGQGSRWAWGNPIRPKTNAITGHPLPSPVSRHRWCLWSRSSRALRWIRH